MTEIVPADQIEKIVGIQRHATRHYARAVSAEQTVYILHSQRCKDGVSDLRVCRYSIALDQGIHKPHWSQHEDRAVRVTINRSGDLIPAVEGMRWAE